MLWIIHFIEIKDTTGSISFEKEDVLIVGEVKGDVSISEGSLIITDSANIVGSVSIFGDSLIIKGKVKGDVSGICNKIIISGNIKGDVALIGKYVKNDGYLNGDLSVIALNFENNGKIEGEKRIISPRALLYLLKENEEKHQKEKNIHFKIIHFKIREPIFILSMIILSIITFLISRALIPNLFEKLYENPIRTTIVGVIFVLLFFPIMIFLIISILGILLIPIYLIACIALLLISYTFGLILVGRIISRDYVNDVKNMIIGISIIIALFLLKSISIYVPYLDILMAIIFYSFIFTITTIGIGSVLRLVFKI